MSKIDIEFVSYSTDNRLKTCQAFKPGTRKNLMLQACVGTNMNVADSFADRARQNSFAVELAPFECPVRTQLLHQEWHGNKST